MRKTRNLFVVISFILAIFVLAWLLIVGNEKYRLVINEIHQLPKESSLAVFPTSKIITPSPSVTTVAERPIVEHDVHLDVPFIVQAPRHNWGDLLYQNACEEAVALMAMRWVEGRSITSEEAYVELKKLSDFSQEKYGFYLDQSAEDLVRLMRDYFNYKDINYREGVGVSDIKKELMKGKIVLIPVNAQKLGNPFFTPPGPIQHMLVVKGYDAEKREFITNDPGIGRGNGYRYKEEVLEKSLQSYPTGYHEPIVKVEKVMIVVGKV